MTDHYFEDSFVKLHYYKFGTGSKQMLCFHGFGMHGKQFRVLEEKLGSTYTFWGFDLLFHKQTALKDNNLATIKNGIPKSKLAEVIRSFCNHEQINDFSVIGYSMGTHYATALVEEMPERINEYIVAAPSSLNPGVVVRFFGKNKLGNKMLEKLILNEKVTLGLINLFRRLRIIDNSVRAILFNEVSTPQLRFALYATFTSLKRFETDEEKLIRGLTTYQIKSIFIFGKRDRNYLPAIGNTFFKKYTPTEIIILDEDHDMINPNFATKLATLLA
ncbi:alpha/beta hydrolase [Pedobacter sp. Du54]|uniref:alpha/beta fold hydrolase n=1 Tax=Pedobacter anseongensis TaxID=3133439 RepID=UPI0030983C12